MKNLKYLFGALLISAVGFTSCNGDDPIPPPEPPDPPAPTLPEVEAREGYVMIVLNTVNEAEVCNGLVFAGNFNDFNTAEAIPFVEIEDFDGDGQWWVAAVPLADLDAGEEYLRGKPNQLNDDGSFPGSWDFQWFAQLDGAGDVINESEVIEGDAYVNEEFNGEMELRIREGAFDGVVYIRAFAWKRNPCVEPETFDITFRVTVPELPEEYVVTMNGEMNNWANDGYEPIQLTRVNATTWEVTLSDVLEGAQYKYLLNGNWAYEEIAAVPEGEECAGGVGNRRVNDRTMNDTVANFRNVTATHCDDVPTDED